MTATHWKLIWVAVAAVLYTAADYVPGGGDELQQIAAFAFGAAMVRRPGDK